MTVLGETESVQGNTKTDDGSKQDATFGDKEVKDAPTESKEAANSETKEKSGQDAVVPEKYDLKLPEGSLLSASQLEALATYSKENKLTAEQAQGLLEREHQAVATYVENQKQELAKKPEAWLAEAQADKEIGGDKFGENTELAKRALATFGSDTLKKILNDTGLGNHPELVRAFVRIGKAMSDDKLVLPGAHAGGKKSIEDIFYGKSDE
jgi:hypothetical protein